jgi:hypothetical protein
MTRKLFFLGTILFSSHAALADYCSDLQQAGLIFGIPAATYTMNAGEKLKVPVQATLKNPSSWDSMEHVELQLTAEIAHPQGAAPLSVTLVLKDGGKLNPLPTEIELQSTAAMGGDYLISSFLSGGDCGIPSDKLPGVTFTVVNSPDKIELNPPVVKAVQFKKSYDINQPMSFTADIEDRSAICVEGLKAETCQATIDIYFGDEDGGLIFVSTTAAATPRPGRYSFTFNRTGFWHAGNYPIYGIQVQDKWGNQAGELAAAVQKTLVVTGKPK